MFIRCTRTHISVAPTVSVEALTDAANRDWPVDAEFCNSHDTLWFLHETRERIPTVHTVLVEALTDATNRDRLVDAAFRGHLNDLLCFLPFARKHFPAVHTALVEVLSDAANRDELVNAALYGEPSDLVSFLDYAREHIPAVHTVLVEGMGDRLQYEVERLDPSDHTEVSSFLECLGSASLIGVTLPHQALGCLDDRTVAGVVAWEVADRTINERSQSLIQLWLG